MSCCRTRLARRLVTLALALLAVGMSAAAGLPPPTAGAAAVRPAALLAIDEAAGDDPRQAVALARRQLATATDPETRFWAELGLARTQSQLEDTEAARASLARARAALDAWPGATPRHRAWLSLVDLEATWTEGTPQQAQARVTQLREHPASREDPLLACEAQALDLALLIDIDSLDEAWLAAEAVERCGRALALPLLESTGIGAMAMVASRGAAAGAAPVDPLPYAQRALQVLGERPARMRRSVLAWDRGGILRRQQRWDEALQQYELARQLSRALEDRAGIAAANIELAVVHLQRQQPARALPLLQEARRLLDGHDNGYRLLSVAQNTVRALAQLKRPEVIAEIGYARRWDTPNVPPAERRRLAHALAAGYASQGRWAEAYAEMERAEAFEREGRAVSRDAQILRLQARYASAQRDAENAELRHRGEAARLQLEAESARQRALWTVVALLSLLLLGGGGWMVGLLARRRSLAALALRDELTGQPNRRAVAAYAQAQFEQAQRLGVPLSLALIDLDHFKRVNDTHGHAAGDAVLRALAQSARAVLRGQDRLGRWGGEEWLLVMPGTTVAELPAVFERLRARFAQAAIDGLPLPHGCTFSMGAAEVAPQTPSLEALLQACDRQLYRAKDEGRDRLCVAD